MSTTRKAGDNADNRTQDATRNGRQTHDPVRVTASRFDVLMDNLPFGVVFEDDVGQVAYVNRGFCDLFGMGTPDGIRQMSFDALVERLQAQVRDDEYLVKITGVLAAQGEAAKGLELELRDGRVLELDYLPVLTDGTFTGHLWQFRDETERYQAEQKRRERDAYLRVIIDNAPIILFTLDRSGVLTSIEGRGRQSAAGIFPPSMANRSLLDMVRGTPMSWLTDEFDRALSGEEVTFDVEFGTLVFQLRLTPIKDGDGVLGVATNVTEHTRTEEALRQHNSYLESLHEMTLGLVNRLDLDDLLQGVVTRAAEMLGTGNGYIYLVDANQETLTVHYGCGIFDRYIGFQIGKGEGVGGRVWETGRPVALSQYDAWANRALNFDYDVIQAVIGVPLKSGDEVIGVIGVATTEGARVFGEDEVKILSQFAELASIAIDNARLYTAAQQELVERKRTEEALIQSEERYRTIIESINDGYYENDLRGRLTFVNDAFADMFGYSREEIIGRSYRQFSDDEEAARLFRVFNEVYRTGVSQRAVDAKVMRRDGETRFVEVSVSLIHDRAGRPVGFRGIVRDITERKQMEQTLQASESRYRTVISSMGEGVLLLDADGRISAYNETALKIMRLTPEQLSGEQPFDETWVTVREDGTPYKRDEMPGYRSLRTGEPIVSETMGISINGRVVAWISANAQPVFHDGDGRPGAVVVSFSDITARRQAEFELAKRVDALAALQQVDSELTQSLNIDYVLAVALDATVRLSGAHAGFIGLVEDGQIVIAQVIGPYPPARVSPRAYFNSPLTRRVLQTRRPVRLVDVTTDRDYVSLISSTQALQVLPLVSHDTLVGILNLETSMPERFTEDVFQFLDLLTARIAVALDNARLYQISQTQLTELQAVHEQVSELEQLKTQMIRVAAHDLRSPLGVISGYLSLMQDDMGEAVADQYKAFFDPILRAIQRMQRMTTDVLSLERIHAAQAKQWEAVNLRDLVDRAFIDHRELAGQKGVQLASDLPSDDVLVLGDPVQLYEAVANVITNGIKYTPTGGQVAVRLTRTDNLVYFEVEDTGYGVPVEFQSKLFEPFYRVKTQETRTIDGTGLGLYLVKGIIERHGGQMKFRSVYGQGSTFGFDLPMFTQSVSG